MNSEWPFIIIRNYGTGKANHNFTVSLFNAQKRYPGLVNEIWFGGGGSLDGLNVIEEKIQENLPYRDSCNELGIKFSFQQGVTLNHDADGKDHGDFTDSDWSITADGKMLKGILCPRSEKTYEYNLKVAKTIMSALKPDSYWPDDDDRLSCKPMICFCERCLAAFNAEYHHDYTRAGLKAALESDDLSVSLPARKEWTEFNSKSLALFSKVYREAAEAVLPDCRLGLQTVCPHSLYDGPDFRPMLAAMSGKDGKKVGIRPGAGYYLDRAPRDMFSKSLGMIKEGARCRKYGFIGQICAEVENWPHVGAEKNPNGQMAESALYLASGVDSLALYWGTDLNRESEENCRFYFDTLAAWKPFLTAVRDAFADTEVSGIATFHGANQLAGGYWENQSCDLKLVENAVPVTKQEALPEAYALPCFAVAELTESDLAAVFAKPVLMDVSSFNELAKRFPNVQFTKKVSIRSFQDLALATAARTAFEVFEGDKRAMDFNHIITPKSNDVRPCSGVTGMDGACGTCVIPTEFGGSVVLMQGIENGFLWTGYRRKTVLNALDSLLPDGGMSVRLMTDATSVCVIGRKTRAGKTAGAFLLNAGIGETMPLELAIRNPAYRSYRIRRPKCEPQTAEIVSRSSREIVLRLDGIPGWQPVLIEGVK